MTTALDPVDHVLTVRPLSVAELVTRPETPALLAEYRAESAVAEFKDSAGPQWDVYAGMEAQGVLATLGAFTGAELVGFLSFITTVLPHFGERVATTESFFVAAKARHTGAGLSLLRHALRAAEDAGACGMLASAPEGSRLARVLPRVGMRPSHRVFFKLLGGRAPPAQLPALCDADMGKVMQLQAQTLEQPQVHIDTQHALHAGMYARTIMIPAGTVLVGAHIVKDTVLVFDGDASVFVGGDEGQRRYTGHHVILGAAGRKQVFYAHADTHLTMVLPTAAGSVADAENEFTSEPHNLGSRRPGSVNHTLEYQT